MSSIEITKEKIIIKKREIDGIFNGLVFNKDELSEIIIFKNIGEVLKLQIKEKTKIKIETLEMFRFNRHTLSDNILRLELREELS